MRERIFLDTEAISVGAVRKVSIVMAAIGWILLLGIGLREQYADFVTPTLAPLPAYFKGVCLFLFVAGIYIFSSIELKKKELDFSHIFWTLFVVAFITAFLSVMVNFFMYFFEEARWSVHPFWYGSFFYVEYGAMIVYLVTVFVAWKRLILYGKGRFVQYSWICFEVLIAIFLASHFFSDTKPSLSFHFGYVFLAIWILSLSINVKWIPLLNFNQKLATLLQLFFILISLIYFFTTIDNYLSMNLYGVEGLLQSIFIIALFTFTFIYGVVAGLFVIFNLPTSSEFDKKLQEISIFQELSSTIKQGKNEYEIYKVLLQAAGSITNSQLGWIQREEQPLIVDGITKEEAVHFMMKYNTIIKETSTARRVHYNPYFGRGRKMKYYSILIVRISGREEHLVLLSSLHNAYDKMMEKSVLTYVNQAGIAISNLELMSLTVESEVWKQQLEIARKVQERLMPKRWAIEQSLEIAAISEPAIEVGGDYYDSHQQEGNKFSIMIADVAGKGIQASFHMAQLKGIFQSLMNMELSPMEVMTYANKALKNCLEKKAFVTATYMEIDTEQRQLEQVRAGHCPTLYFSKEEQRAFYLQQKGLGLGIIRNDSFQKYISTESIPYYSGDLIVLYTDGIVEARRQDKELFGYDRLREYIQSHYTLPVKEMAEGLLEEVRHFSGDQKLTDDFTLIIIRF
ncbi:SpoIIE family protein phosphatase [Algivirga pacifica]|uniref:PPM-type phosphatase domain-containing protein n=1 Tax=Algivirga pacifica TaxID=1162670 RepID=A0ABP9D5I4_9BACT